MPWVHDADISTALVRYRGLHSQTSGSTETSYRLREEPYLPTWLNSEADVGTPLCQGLTVPSPAFSFYLESSQNSVPVSSSWSSCLAAMSGQQLPWSCRGICPSVPSSKPQSAPVGAGESPCAGQAFRPSGSTLASSWSLEPSSSCRGHQVPSSAQKRGLFLCRWMKKSFYGVNESLIVTSLCVHSVIKTKEVCQQRIIRTKSHNEHRLQRTTDL